MALVPVVVLAVVVGLSLGLLGGGGSILAVPLLVYVASLDPQQAVATSLVVVGVTSAIAVLPHARRGRVHWRAALPFAAGAMGGAYVGGRAATLVPGSLLLLAFAAMMLLTAGAMIRGRRSPAATAPGAAGGDGLGPAGLVGIGVLVGALTGFVGAGGGFLIVPALTLAVGLEMPVAVGTSLLVITLQSAAGLLGHLHGTQLPWAMALSVTGAAVLGSLAGAHLAGRVPQPVLRRAFGVMVLGMGVLVMAQQLPAVLTGANDTAHALERARGTIPHGVYVAR